MTPSPHSVRVPDHLAGDVGLILSVLGWDAVDPEPASWGGQRAAARDALVGLVEQLEALEGNLRWARDENTELQEQFETLRDLVTRLVNEEQDTNPWSDIYDVLWEQFSEERNPASEPGDDSMMLRHADGSPYMDVRDYQAQRGDPPRLRYGDSNQDTERS